METKKIIIILIITCIIVAGATYILTNNTPINKTQVNNTTNITKNTTTNITNKTINATASDEPVVTNTEKSSYSSSSDEPEYGSDDYVKKWDKSQKGDGDWAYHHDQPVKKENGHEYVRIYDSEKGKSYWDQIDKDYE